MSDTCTVTARTFRLDVTPAVGDYVCGGLYGRSIGVETPLELRGVLLEGAQQRCAIVAIDYCYLCGLSHRRMVEAVAEAAGLPVSSVAVQANHVHDAPLINEEAHSMYAEFNPGLHNESYFADVLQRTKQAISAVRRDAGIVLRDVSFSGARVDRFASTRRVKNEQGRCVPRWSVLWRAEDMHLKHLPEGKIDPQLDQICFYDGDGRARISLSFYACHPQVSCGRGLWSSDTIGVARDLFEKANPGVFALNFDGCGGDVTAGKYTTMNRERNRVVFGVRLYEAMQEAFDIATPHALKRLGWFNHAFDMPLHAEERDAAHYEAILRDHSRELPDKYLAGLKLFKLRSGRKSYPFELSRLVLNDDSVLFMPAELCVEYQLYAKRKAAANLAAAAYADCFLNYVATDEAFEEGGYEVDPDWTEVGPGCEGLIKAGIDRILSM